MRAVQVSAPVCYHGEGPCWSPSWGGLRFVDMLAGDVMTLLGDGAVRRTPTGSAVTACIRPRTSGGAIVALERGFALAAEEDLSDLTPLPEVFSDKGIRFNEGGCDPDGRFYCGTMAYDRTEGAATLYRLDPGEQHATPVITDATISNGFAFSPDGATAYYIDTPTGRIDAFDYSRERGLTNRHRHVEVPEDDGRPDGLTVDADGRIWVALNGGGKVRCYGTDGRVLEQVDLPVRLVTACTFGGDDLQTLFITTSRENLPDDVDPEAGAVFALGLGVRGLPVLPFAG